MWVTVTKPSSTAWAGITQATKASQDQSCWIGCQLALFALPVIHFTLCTCHLGMKLDFCAGANSALLLLLSQILPYWKENTIRLTEQHQRGSEGHHLCQTPWELDQGAWLSHGCCSTLGWNGQSTNQEWPPGSTTGGQQTFAWSSAVIQELVIICL